MAHVPLTPIGSPRRSFLSDPDWAQHRARMGEREALLAARRAEVAAGWGPGYVERVHQKGKLTARERLLALQDPGAPVHEVGTFVNWGETFGGKLKSPAAGVVCAFTRVEGRWVMVIANDNTVASGSWWPRTPEKIERAQEMALRLRVPVVYLVDCSGLYLPEQSRTFPGATGAGHIFQKNAALSAAGVPQIAGVFGDCIAGGGYMPIISDRVIMTEQAYMVIAGAALIKGAKSLKMTSLDIGGPEVHVHLSGCADLRVPDDQTALRAIRREVSRLPRGAAPYYRGEASPLPPAHDPGELAGIVPADHRLAYDVRQVLARLVDASLFWELWPGRGAEVVVGVGRVNGLYLGFAANQPALVPDPEAHGRVRPGGILYREGIAKLAQFARACDSDGIPLVWLQDVSGFDIGREAEVQGLLGWGSSLIYQNSVARTPCFTVLLRRASGAGYYALCGRPYDPVVQLCTPVSRLSVMEGRTLSIATYNTKLDDEFRIATQDEKERAEIEAGMKQVEERIEADMDPWVAARNLDADEIVSLPELRGWLEALGEMAYDAIGARTVKNPRIWSLHDLAALDDEPSVPEPTLHCGLAPGAEPTLLSPGVGQWVDAPAPGTWIGPGSPLGRLLRPGAGARLVAPEGAAGVVQSAGKARDAQRRRAVEHGEPLLRLHAVAHALPATSPEAALRPDGHLVLRAPQAGRFYHRPGPDQPPFVRVGEQVADGAAVGLIEVMKTFFQLRWGDPALGAELSGAARVVRHLAGDGAEVEEGQALLELEPA